MYYIYHFKPCQRKYPLFGDFDYRFLFFRLLFLFIKKRVFEIRVYRGVAVTLHTRSCGNELTDDNILLKTYKRVHLSLYGSVRKNLRGFLEGCG